MGTSTNYNPPTSPDWRTLKTRITRLVNSGSQLDYDSARQLVQDYIHANGGPQRMVSGGGVAGGSKAAQDIGRRLAGFISSVGRVGLQNTFEQAGLGSLEGKSVHEITFALMDYIGGSASRINDVDARNALSDLRKELFKDADTPEKVEYIMEALLEGKELEKLLIKFFGLYLYQQFCRVFYEKFIELVGEIKADKFQNQIKSFILSMLRNITIDQDVTQIDWSGDQGKAIADKILQKTLEVFTA